MFHHDKQELKQQGAIEAAQDPNSKVTAEDAERTIVQQTKAAGGAAFHFDANATPAEKAAQAHAVVPDNFHHEKKILAKNVVTDQDGMGSKPDYDLPPATTSGVVAKAEQDALNGHQAADSKYASDRTGWAPRLGNGDPADDEGPTQLDHQTWVEGQLDEQWYGEWYYNAAVIVFACLSTYVVTTLGGGLASVFIVMACCSTYYRTSLRRVRRNFRDDIRRQVAKEKLDSDQESLEWINSFLVKFWPIFAPVLSESVINSVDQVLATSTPAFLESLRLKTFILGTKPPRLEHVKTYAKTDPDVVEMDWAFSFNPNDTADMTARQLKNKINPKVVLEIRVGVGIVSKGLDAIVEDMAFSGLMKVKLKLQIPFPHIERAEVSFLGRPTIDYVCKPLGGDTFGMDINFIPGLESFILEQIHANLGPMFYAPNVFPIEVAKIMSGNAVDQAIGVLQVTLHGAQGLKNPDKFPGTPDPYVQIGINSRSVIATSSQVKQNSNPRWNETFNVIITSYRDSLTLQTYDYNEYRKDKDLGTATFALEKLHDELVHENMQLEVMSSGHARGIIMADIRFFPILTPDTHDGVVGPVPESNSGIAKFTIEQAKDLDGSRSLVGALNPYAILLLNGKEVHTSRKMTRTNNPIWPDAMKELLVTDRKNAKLGVVVKDERDLGADPIIGTYQIKLDDMIDLTLKGQEWYNLANTQTGRVKMMLQWKPVNMSGSINNTGGYVTPVGVMRLHFHAARELRNLETVGKSDPYVRVLLYGVEKGRTVTHKNTLNPDFDEVVYVPMHSAREKMIIEIMDEEKLGKDRSLGQFEILASDYIHQAQNGEYLESEQHPPHDALLQLNGKGSPKGRLNFSCAFFPALSVEEPSDDSMSVNGAGRGRAESRASGTRLSAQSQSAHSFTSAHSGPRSVQASELAQTLAAGEAQQHETDDVAHAEAAKIQLGPEDLKHYQSGLVVIKLVDAELAHSDCFVDFVVDDYLFPSFRSSKARSKKVTFNETGDAMVRELDFSRLTIRIREKEGESDKEKVYAKLSGQTLETLTRHLYRTMPITLVGDDGKINKIHIQLKYIPVKMKLHPAESINNMGTLRCDILDATDLPAADRNGYSDPYCKIVLNGEEVYKTATQKKTLNPKWNESFEIPVPSRTAAKFRIEVFDRDLGDRDDFLGAAEAQLQVLEPFQSQEVRLRLDGQSGAIRVKFLFRSDYVTRKRKGSGTFSGTFSSPSRLAAAPTRGASKTASFFARGLRRKTNGDVASPAEDSDFGTNSTPLATIDSSEENNGISHQSPSQPPIIAGTSAGVAAGPYSPPQQPDASNSYNNSYLSPNRPSTAMDTDASSVATQRPAQSENGTVSFTVISATGFTGHAVRAFIKQQQPAQQQGNTKLSGMKDVHKTKSARASPEGVVYWGETDTYRVRCTSDTYFAIQLKDVHTFGSDTDYGEAPLSVVAGGVGAQQTVRVGKGSVLVRTEWQPQQQVGDGTESISGRSMAGSMAPSVAGSVAKSTVPENGAAGTLSPSGAKSPRSKLRKSFGVGSSR